MPIQHRAEGEPISTQFTVWASIVPCVIAEAAMKSNSMAASTCRTVVDFVLRDIVSLLNRFPSDFHLGRPAITGSRSWGNSENTSVASLTSRLRFSSAASSTITVTGDCVDPAWKVSRLCQVFPDHKSVSDVAGLKSQPCRPVAAKSGSRGARADQGVRPGVRPRGPPHDLCVIPSFEKTLRQNCHSLLMRRTNALQQLLEARVGFQVVAARIGIQKDKPAFAAPVLTIQQLQSAIDLSQLRIDFHGCTYVGQSTAGA